jgi:hypothetical protein
MVEQGAQDTCFDLQSRGVLFREAQVLKDIVLGHVTWLVCFCAHVPISSFPGESVVGPDVAVHGRSPNPAGLSCGSVSQNSARRRLRSRFWTNTPRDTMFFHRSLSTPRHPGPAIASVAPPTLAFDPAVTATESTRARPEHLLESPPGSPWHLLPNEFRQPAVLLRAFESHPNLAKMICHVYNFYYKIALTICSSPQVQVLSLRVRRQH